MPGLSTSCFARKGFTGDEIVAMSREVGARYLELEYRMRPDVLRDTLEAASAHNLEIRSLHNFCPCPDEIPFGKEDADYFSLSSLDDDEWNMALRYSTRTLESANRAGARRVVFHLGDSGIDREKPWFIATADAGKLLDNESREKIKDHLERRKNSVPPHLDRAKQALDRLLPRAEKYGVIIGLENRYYLSQIPSFDEIRHLCHVFQGGPLGPWIDWGHACATGLFGTQGLDDFLNGFPSPAGYHVHDVTGRKDHQPPGQGTVDFTRYDNLLKASPCNIIELRAQYNLDEIREGIDIIRRLETG